MPTTIIIEHLIFFIVGVLQDVIVTLYYQSINDKKPMSAAWLSGIITVVNLTVFYGILSALDDTVYSRIGAYAVGNAVGTYIIVRRDKGKQPSMPTTSTTV